MPEVPEHETQISEFKIYRKTDGLIDEIMGPVPFPGGAFYTRAEVAERFGIGMITAAKVFAELETRGYIRQKPKLRPVISQKFSLSSTSHAKLPVAILVPCGDYLYMPHRSIWYNLTYRRIEQKILEKNYPVELIQLERTLGDVKKKFSGLILFDRIEFFPEVSRMLANSGLPYVITTGERIRSNAVFFEVEAYIREIFMETMKRDIHRIVLISSGRDTAESFRKYHEGAFFRGLASVYGYHVKLESVYFEYMNEKNMLAIMPYVQELRQTFGRFSSVFQTIILRWRYEVLEQCGVSPSSTVLYRIPPRS